MACATGQRFPSMENGGPDGSSCLQGFFLGDAEHVSSGQGQLEVETGSGEAPKGRSHGGQGLLPGARRGAGIQPARSRDWAEDGPAQRARWAGSGWVRERRVLTVDPAQVRRDSEGTSRRRSKEEALRLHRSVCDVTSLRVSPVRTPQGTLLCSSAPCVGGSSGGSQMGPSAAFRTRRGGRSHRHVRGRLDAPHSTRPWDRPPGACSGEEGPAV